MVANDNEYMTSAIETVYLSNEDWNVQKIAREREDYLRMDAYRKRRIEELTSENQKLSTDNEKLSTDNEKLSSDNEKLSSDNEKLSSDIIELKDRIKELEDQLNSKKM